MTKQVVSLAGTLAGMAIPLFFSFETIFVPLSMWIPVGKFLSVAIPFLILLWRIWDLEKTLKEQNRKLAAILDLQANFTRAVHGRVMEESQSAANLVKSMDDSIRKELEEFREISKN